MRGELSDSDLATAALAIDKGQTMNPAVQQVVSECGVRVLQPTTYTLPIKQAFISGCTTQVGASQAVCTRYFECTKSKISYADYAAANRALAAGQPQNPKTQRALERCYLQAKA